MDLYQTYSTFEKVRLHMSRPAASPPQVFVNFLTSAGSHVCCPSSVSNLAQAQLQSLRHAHDMPTIHEYSESLIRFDCVYMCTGRGISCIRVPAYQHFNPRYGSLYSYLIRVQYCAKYRVLVLYEYRAHDDAGQSPQSVSQSVRYLNTHTYTSSTSTLVHFFCNDLLVLVLVQPPGTSVQ